MAAVRGGKPDSGSCLFQAIPFLFALRPVSLILRSLVSNMDGGLESGAPSEAARLGIARFRFACFCLTSGCTDQRQSHEP